jgi:hypothetical protein
MKIPLIKYFFKKKLKLILKHKKFKTTKVFNFFSFLKEKNYFFFSNLLEYFCLDEKNL